MNWLRYAAKGVMGLSIALWLAAIAARLLAMQSLGSPEEYAQLDQMATYLTFVGVTTYALEWFFCLGFLGSTEKMKDEEKRHWNLLLLFFGPVAVPYLWFTQITAIEK